MSAIDTFLQKRKPHESQYGFIMVFVAYVISAILLILGSDMFYNISSAAAGIGMPSEEAQQVYDTKLYNPSQSDLPSASLLVNPYGITEAAPQATELQSPKETFGNSDTVWFMGNSMDGATFDSVARKLGSSTDKKDRASKDAVINSQSAKETGAYAGITDSEVDMLERIVQAEAGGEDMIGKILIVNVIMNRVASNHFPDSIKGVIFQQKDGGYQFSPVGDKRYWSVRISDSTRKAVARALNGEDYSKGALYFVARRKSDSSSMRWFDGKLNWLFKHGGHEFYKNK